MLRWSASIFRSQIDVHTQCCKSGRFVIKICVSLAKSAFVAARPRRLLDALTAGIRKYLERMWLAYWMRPCELNTWRNHAYE